MNAEGIYSSYADDPDFAEMLPFFVDGLAEMRVTLTAFVAKLIRFSAALEDTASLGLAISQEGSKNPARTLLKMKQ
jgi:hypothetical protein